MRRAGTATEWRSSWGSTHFLLIMKHTPPPLVFSGHSAVLSICKTEKLSDGVTSGVRDRRREPCFGQTTMLSKSLNMSHWKLILALRSSILFSKDWTLASRILGRGGLWALFLSLLRIPARSSRDVSFASCGYSGGHCSTRWSEVSPMATLGPWIKCPESG